MCNYIIIVKLSFNLTPRIAYYNKVLSDDDVLLKFKCQKMMVELILTSGTHCFRW